MANTEVSRGRKYTTLEELETSDKGPVWVLNNTRDNLEGKVIVSIPKKNGNGADMIRVPRSFVPFDLTQQVGRSQLIESAEFRKTINTKLIKLITPEYAAVLLSTEEAKEEQTRLINEENKAKMLLKKAGVVDQGTGVGEDDEEEYFEVAGKDSAAAPKKRKKAVDSVKEASDAEAATKTIKRGPSVKVQAIVANASRDGMSEVQIVSKLKNATLKKADLAYLSQQYGDKPKIMKHLKATLREMKAAA